MRKLIVSEFVTLDGVMQAPGGKDEDLDGGFEHGGWTMPYWHDDIGRSCTLGKGKRVFPPEGLRKEFKLRSATPYPTGVVGLDYVR